MSDEIDYYPEEYLIRLVHDGANGLWIYKQFQDLHKSDISPEYGVGRERWIEKLKGVIRRCARYGIKIYIFAIEPAAISQEMSDKYPQVRAGWRFCGKTCFLYAFRIRRKLLYRNNKKIGGRVAGAGGLISITSGERLTSCASAKATGCPRCDQFRIGENLSYTVNLLKEGMRQTESNAEF